MQWLYCIWQSISLVHNQMQAPKPHSSSSAHNVLTLIFHSSLIFQHDDLVNRTKDLEHLTKLVFCHIARDLPNEKFDAISVWLLWVIIWAILSMRRSNALYANSVTFKLHFGFLNAIMFNIQRLVIQPFVSLRSLKIPVTTRTALSYTKEKINYLLVQFNLCKEESNQIWKILSNWSQSWKLQI